MHFNSPILYIMYEVAKTIGSNSSYDALKALSMKGILLSSILQIQNDDLFGFAHEFLPIRFVLLVSRNELTHGVESVKHSDYYGNQTKP